MEFDVFEDGKIPIPKLSSSGMKFGRKRFVVRKSDNNGNGNNNNRQGSIVQFIPFATFTGNINDVSTTTFRAMKFDGLILFEELNGCLGNAYRIEKGVVMTKLETTQANQVTPRCGITWAISTEYWVNSGGNETYQGPGPVRYETEIPCWAASVSTSYDAGYTAGSTANGGSSSFDSYYDNYLGTFTISVARTICASTFQFRAVTSTTNNTAANRWEAGIRNDGFRFGSPNGVISVGFDHITFALPMFNRAYNNTNGTATTNADIQVNAARLLANQINLSVNQIQQQINMPPQQGTTPIALTSAAIGAAFWNQLDINLATALSVAPTFFSKKGTSATVYEMDGVKTTIIYNVPVTGCQ